MIKQIDEVLTETQRKNEQDNIETSTKFAMEATQADERFSWEKEPEYDEESILKNLGANYTAENIDTLIRQGKVEEYITEDGKIAFRYTQSYLAPQNRPDVDTQTTEKNPNAVGTPQRGTTKLETR